MNSTLGSVVPLAMFFKRIATNFIKCRIIEKWTQELFLQIKVIPHSVPHQHNLQVAVEALVNEYFQMLFNALTECLKLWK